MRRWTRCGSAGAGPRCVSRGPGIITVLWMYPTIPFCDANLLISCPGNLILLSPLQVSYCGLCGVRTDLEITHFLWGSTYSTHFIICIRLSNDFTSTYLTCSQGTVPLRSPTANRTRRSASEWERSTWRRDVDSYDGPLFVAPPHLTSVPRSSVFVVLGPTFPFIYFFEKMKIIDAVKCKIWQLI